MSHHGKPRPNSNRETGSPRLPVSVSEYDNDSNPQMIDFLLSQTAVAKLAEENRTKELIVIEINKKADESVAKHAIDSQLKDRSDTRAFWSKQVSKIVLSVLVFVLLIGIFFIYMMEKGKTDEAMVLIKDLGKIIIGGLGGWGVAKSQKRELQDSSPPSRQN